MSTEPMCILLCLTLGEPCDYAGKPGVCKSIYECPVVRTRVTVDEEKPLVMCKWERMTRIVCCPNEDLAFTTGMFKDYFKGTDKGVMRSTEMTCRYDGKQPVTCCQNLPDYPQHKEPAGCPKLNSPTVDYGDHHASKVVWEKCLDYQKYANKCVASEEKPNEFTRTSTCGIPTDRYRIAGGQAAAKKEFPHMAALGCQSGQTSSDFDIVWVGGGSLISDKFILTAGHVLVSLEHHSLKYALLGSVNKTDIKNGFLYNIIRRIGYPTYTATNKRDDIALVELDRPVKFTEFVRPACLPVPGLRTEEEFVVAGWGYINQHRNTTERLLMTEVNEAKGSECATKLKTSNFEWKENRMMCMVGRELSGGRFTDSCEGDSGGPLMSRIHKDLMHCMYVIKGIVSWGPTCGEGFPAVYTRVVFRDYLDWIVSQVWPEEKQKSSLFLF